LAGSSFILWCDVSVKVGADDGTIKIFRDDGDGDFSGNNTGSNVHQNSAGIGASSRNINSGPATASAGGNSALSRTSDGISLASAFTALPDIDDNYCR
jgi:hypothetical protein